MFRSGFAVFFVWAAVFAAQGQQANAPIAAIESLIRSQQYDQALESARSALQQAPGNIQLWTLEGVVLSLKGRSDGAINAYEKALSLSPNYPAALRGEVQLLFTAQDKRAIPLLERILKADPRDKTAHEMLALLEAKQGNCKIANEHFLQSGDVIATHPQSLEAYGNCLVNTQRQQEAISVFEQLSALLPQRTYPKYDLAVMLVETKQYDAALKILEPILAADMSDSDILSLAAEAYEAVGNTPRAVALLRQAIVLSPTNSSYYISFAALCMDHDSFQVGIDMIDAGLQRISNDGSLYISRGLLYAKLAQFDKAEDDFKTAERYGTAQSLSAYATDLAEIEKDHSEHAISQIRLQLKAHPENPMLHYLLAKLLSTKGDDTEVKVSGEAMKSVLIAVKLKPDLLDARNLLTSMYMSSGQYNLAIAQSRLALKYAPSDRTAIYHLIISLRKSKQAGTGDEIQTLVKRLSELQQESLKHETDRNRYMLVEEKAPPANSPQ